MSCAIVQYLNSFESCEDGTVTGHTGLSALFTDYYEFMMMQACIKENMNVPVVFDMFYRTQPFNGGYAVFAGISELVSLLTDFTFSDDDIQYLQKLGTFEPFFLEYLREYRFSGDLWAMQEGSVCFPLEPLVRIHSSLAEAQLIEGLVLNLLNFQTLVATKAARIVHASDNGNVIEFGLRRAQGVNGALWASRAAYIGGAFATSNVLAGKHYEIPVAGTMAHSWIMACESEVDAFQRYADVYPQNLVFLIDTYDTLYSGIENAIRVIRTLRKGEKNIGIRLDSGDIEYLSNEVRKRLDRAGLSHVSITVSNELDEKIIHHLVQSQCPIDYWGVGTNLVTGGDSSSLSGVYKMAAKEIGGRYIPTIKVSDNPEKTTNPGIKQVYRFEDEGGQFQADYIALDDEPVGEKRVYTFHHPVGDYRYFEIANPAKATPLLSKIMHKGKVCTALPSLSEIRDYAIRQLRKLDATYKRIINPHVYKVSISEKLRDLKRTLIYKDKE